MGEEKTVVALRRCMTYDEPTVQEAVDDLFALCGGIENIVKLGQRVLVKLNLLMKRTPDRATTTHPAVARAIVRAIQNAGATAILADSPGGPFTRGMLAGVYEACGDAAGKHVLLIDDICTTGATLSECARVLKDAGAESVVCAAVSKTRRTPKK